MNLNPIWLVFLEEEIRTQTWKKNHVRTRGGGGHLKLRREASEETNTVDTLILDFLLLKLWGNKCLLFKPSSLWFFVMVAWANCNTGSYNTIPCFPPAKRKRRKIPVSVDCDIYHPSSHVYKLSHAWSLLLTENINYNNSQQKPIMANSGIWRLNILGDSPSEKEHKIANTKPSIKVNI